MYIIIIIIIIIIIVCCLLSSPVLLRKPTTVQWITQLDSDLLDCVTCFYGFLIVFWPPVYPLLI